jgi:hypothetical protein
MYDEVLVVKTDDNLAITTAITPWNCNIMVSVRVLS